jgi:hypothetical protein
MNEPISRSSSLQRHGFACALWCVGISACGASTTDRHPEGGAGDNPAGASHRSAGGTSSGSGGSQPAAEDAGGSSGGSDESSGAGSGAAATIGGSGGMGGTGGGKEPGVELGYCPGEVPRSGYAPCATDANCSGSTPLCRNEPYSGSGLCGACFQPPEPCTSDASCAAGVCAPFTDPCACSAGLRICVAACTATSCASDEECASSGHCVPRSCAADWTCQQGYRCSTPEAGSADKHGCEPVLCTDGYTCPSGFTCSPEVRASRDPHGCSAIHCSEPDGYVCPVNRDCVASSPGNGCVTRQCKISSDCECGTCRGGTCANGPGICLPLPPV